MCIRDRHRNRVDRRSAQREGVARHLFAEHMVKEGIRPGARQPVGIPGSRVEQTNHRVEVAVGPASAAPAVERRTPPTRRDAKGRPCLLYTSRCV